MNKREITHPKLLLVPSVVFRCWQCKRWLYRTVTFMVSDMKGHQCEHCGCTSVDINPGRCYGPRSKWWNQITSFWEEVWFLMDIEFGLLDGVVSDPMVTKEMQEEAHKVFISNL